VEWVWIDGQEKVKEIDTSKPGKHTVRIAKLNLQNKLDYSNEVTVTVKEDKTKAELKNDELYEGEKWDLGRVFKDVVDKDGNPIKPGEVEWVWIDGQEKVKEIDTSKPGKHTVRVAILNSQNKWVYSNEVTVTVKEDKTSLELNLGYHYIYQGEQWDPKRGLKKATDADGNILSIDKVEHWWGGNKPIDPNKVGDTRPYFYRVYRKNGTNKYSSVTVKVKEDKSNIKTKNSILYVGQKWYPKDNFVNATDEAGKSIPWEDPRITKNGASIDTSKPGEYKIKYTFKGKVKNVDSEFTVTVKEEPFTIKQVPYFDFEDHILVSTNKSVVNKKENPTIELETPSIAGKDWQLQVELSPFLDKENSNSILKGVSLFIPKGKLESDLETEEPTQYDCQLEANGKASILMQGTKTKGKGWWKNKLETKGITLFIPSENKTGSYESILHWTLLDVPG
ncbi:bacterial Ig-like domain-containing protein, partial [Enterococcus faecalis]|uniref:bacterial Ig-like domain-containing protein n=1 Tax=Enterococcus faecalis TaxID=1351 RepID=UPI003CC5ECB6